MLANTLRVACGSAILLRRPLTHGHIVASSLSRTPLLVIARSQAPISQRSLSSTPGRAYIKYGKFAAIENVWKKQINLGDILNELRELQAIVRFDGKNSNLAAGRDYKYTERALFPLYHDGKRKIKMEDVKDRIPQHMGRIWTLLAEKVQLGRIALLEDLSSEKRSLAMLNRVANIGPRRAEALYDAGIRTWSQLQAEAAKPEKESMLTHAQQLGVKYFDDIEQLIPASEVKDIQQVLDKAILEADPGFSGEVLGSYRRGNPWCSDVDYIIRHEEYLTGDADISKGLMDKVMKTISERMELVERPLASGDKKVMTIGRLKGTDIWRRIDIRVAPQESYYYMLLGCTGCLELMQYLRDRAKELGLHLNEYGMGKRLTGEERGMKPGATMWDPKHKILVTSEEEIFERLGLPYVPPEKRDYEHWQHILPKRTKK